MFGKVAAHLCLILLFISVLNAQSYTNDQFSKRVDETASAINKAEKTYKDIEKEVKRHFPEGSRKSPIYLAIRDDFMVYREIMKRLNEYNVLLDRNSEKYSKLFGGIFGGKDVIAVEDEEFEQVKKLAVELEEMLEEALNDLARAAPLGNVHRTMLDRIVDIEKFRDDLNGQIRELIRDVEKSSRKNERTFRLFKQSETGMTEYGIYRNTDSVRINLIDAQQNFASLKDSIGLLQKQIQHMLSGMAKRGEEMRVWETYESISVERVRLTKGIEQGVSRIEKLREELENFVKLMSEFGDILTEMDKDIGLIHESYQNAVNSLEEDSLRNSSLIGKMARGYSLEKPPYRELIAAYKKAETTVGRAEAAIENMVESRLALINHVSGMKGLKTDPGKYDRFKELDRNFDSANKSGKKRLKELDDALEAFREVILENFLNTTEYWELVYEVESDKSFGGEETVAENFGYLFDLNELPAEAYHGQLISTLQLRLEKTRKRGQQSWSHQLVFSGEHDFPLEGFILRSPDGSILVKADRDSIAVEEEKNKEGIVQFEWEVPVSQSQLDQMIMEQELIFRVHLITTTHRVNLTLYRERIFRDYVVPEERKEMWQKILQDKIDGV